MSDELIPVYMTRTEWELVAAVLDDQAEHHWGETGKDMYRALEIIEGTIND